MIFLIDFLSFQVIWWYERDKNGNILKITLLKYHSIIVQNHIKLFQITTKPSNSSFWSSLCLKYALLHANSRFFKYLDKS